MPHTSEFRLFSKHSHSSEFRRQMVVSLPTKAAQCLLSYDILSKRVFVKIFEIMLFTFRPIFSRTRGA